MVTEAPLTSDSSHDLGATLRLVRTHQISELRQHLAQILMKQGLQHFVIRTVAPLNQIVGDAWMRGELAVFEEHLYSEQIQATLRAAISNLYQPSDAPRILLTSFPNEEHRLGLLMVEALLTMEGATCVALGNEIPIPEIVQAALAHCADVIALSFSGAFQTNVAVAGLKDLRKFVITSTALKDDEYGRLPAITSLQRLEILSCSLSDAALAHIGKTASLIELDLSSNPITDEGLKQLTGLKKLQRLRVVDTSVTSSNVLAAELPDCKIEFYTNMPISMEVPAAERVSQ
jgi:hypothetical protein